MTEAIHTPFMMDRFIAVDNAKYVMNNMAAFGDDIEFKKDGIMVRRAGEVLDSTVEFLRGISSTGLMEAIAQGMFAEVKRPKDGGKGLEGLVRKDPGYFNPAEDMLEAGLGLCGKGRA